MTIAPYDHLGMSDDALRDERKAQALVLAGKEYIASLRTALGLTSVMRDEILDLIEIIQDTMPDSDIWAERIQDERRAA